jgi:hypothetical protein
MTEGLAATDRTDGALRAEMGVDAPHRSNHPELDRLWARGREFLGADLAILTGDIIYEGGEPQNFTPQYFDIYRPTIAHTPFYPSLGNHDVVTSSGQPYLDAFYLPTNNPAATERYYSFDYSNAHFVALEVTVENTAPSAAMLAWLDADLAATSQLWKFVFFHVPMYSNGGGHGGDAVIAAALGPTFDARGVDVAFQGHNHFYTRTFPLAAGSVVDGAQEPIYQNPGGTIYVVTGGGGRALYALTAPTSIEAYSKSTFHAVAVTVAGSALLLQAIERDGTVMDEMSLVKGTPTGVAPHAASRATASISSRSTKLLAQNLRVETSNRLYWRDCGGSATVIPSQRTPHSRAAHPSLRRTAQDRD